MENILDKGLSKLDGYLLSIQRNTENGTYELEVGIRKSWVYKSTATVDCEVIHETEAGNIVKIFGKDDDVILDELVDFVSKIIDTNKKIAEMEEQFQKQLEEQKKQLQEQIMKFQDELEKVKEKSFTGEDESENDSKTTSLKEGQITEQDEEILSQKIN